MGKQIAVFTDSALPSLLVRVEKSGAREFRIVVCRQPADPFFEPAELPRFTTLLDPTLYVRPSEVMQFVTIFATELLHKAATHLTGTGEYYAD